VGPVLRIGRLVPRVIVCSHVGAGMCDLREPGVGVLPGGQEVRIGFDGSFGIARLFTGERDAVESESGMWTLDKRPLEGRFGLGPFSGSEHGGSFGFADRADVMRRFAVAERLLFLGCVGEERFIEPKDCDASQ